MDEATDPPAGKRQAKGNAASEPQPGTLSLNLSKPDGTAERPEAVLVAVSGSPRSEALVHSAKRLSDALGAPFEAIHVETPGSSRVGAAGARAAEALGLAARLGGTVATIAAASAADGIAAHLESAPADHLVLGRSRRRRRALACGPSLAERIADCRADLVLHVHTHAADERQPTSAPGIAKSEPSLRHYLVSTGLVAGTLGVALLLRLLLGARGLDLLFLFPVIAVSARLGLRPALLAVLLSVLSYNYFLLEPAFTFNPGATQNPIMAAVLIAVAVYTSLMTQRLRERLVLTDRSARENASIAALAQKLTRDSDWESTAQTICEHVHSLLDVQTAVLREVDGNLAIAAAVPPSAALGPIDRAALDWAWANGEEAGSGTAALSAADWQFQPLKTSLGVLAVLGVAREDGRDPVPANQKILLATLVAQAALAHERLRLEDLMRIGSDGTS